MNVCKLAIAFGPLLALAPFHSSAYELATHAKITNAAYFQSKLGSPSGVLHRTLGIDVWTYASTTRVLPFRAGIYDLYTDIRGSDIRARNAKDYEGNIIEKAFGESELFKVNGWLMRGVIREDDSSKFVSDNFRDPKEPLDDLYGDFNRFCNHFFDPLRPIPDAFPNSRGLTTFCFSESPVFDSPQWALGSLRPFDPAPTEYTTRRNHFSVLDAREAMWRALTLRDRAGNSVDASSGVFAGSYVFNSEQIRKVYWATTFRALGDVMHHVQDMAQPQHTRNEGHGRGNTVGYEEYIDARATKAKEFKIDDQTLTAAAGQLPDLTYTGYPSPRFNRYSDYWSTRPNGTALGIADYSNRGFFTPASNFATTNYTQPSSNIADYTVVRTGAPNLGYSSVYLFGTVNDDVLNSTDGLTMSTLSVLPTTGVFRPVMSKRNYDERVALLIPRAAGYSAGLIDYFFRGQMEITPPDEGIYSLVDHFDFSGAGKTATVATTGFKGFKTIKLKLRNTTPDINPSGGGSAAPQQMQNGKLVAVLKFYRNKAYTDNLANEPATVAGYDATRSAAEEIVVSARVKDESGAPVDTISLSPDPATPAKLLYFEFDQELPINATDVKLQVVYRGTLGSEADAVVVQTVDISEPTYFVYMNTSDYIRLNAKVYTRAEINSNDPPPLGELSGSQLRALVRPTNCIDPMTDQLRASCFPERGINFPLHVGTASTENNTTLQFALPQVRTYVRMAMLTPRGVPALLDQRDSSCVPRDIFPLRGRNVQTDYSTDADGSPRISTVVDVDPPPVRGVYGYVLSCVEIGDGTIPGANDTDNRDTKMAPLTGDALKPLLLQNFKFGAP